MQQFTIQTRVEAPFETVRDGFNRSLLEYLLPTFPAGKLARYDGNQPGALIQIELQAFGIRQVWLSKVTEEEASAGQYHFVDEGVELPFFLQKWQHTHLLEREGPHTLITDRIRFEAARPFPGFLVLPVLRQQFLPRKKQYKRYFEKRSSATSPA